MAKFLSIIGLLLLISCSSKQADSAQNMGAQYDSQDEMLMEESPRTAEAPSPPEFSLEKGSKIIKIGDLKFEVSDLYASKQKVDTAVKAFDAYYENEQFNSYGNRNSYTLLIRIPNAKFDSVLIAFENGLGQLVHKNINAKDVTEEYVDLNIRLENNLAYLSQYKEILKQAKTIEEILEVQEKIRRIEEEIESKKGRIQYLDDKVKYSTLTLEITELVSGEISNQPSYGRRLANAAKNGIQGFLSFTVGLVNIWPFLLLLIFAWIFRKNIVNIFKRK